MRRKVSIPPRANRAVQPDGAGPLARVTPHRRQSALDKRCAKRPGTGFLGQSMPH